MIKIAQVGGVLNIEAHWVPFTTELQRTPVADPGFSRGRQPLGLVLKPIIWQNFCSKMHGNERNCTEREYASLVFPFGSTKEHPATILAAVSFASFLSLKTRSRVQIYLILQSMN